MEHNVLSSHNTASDRHFPLQMPLDGNASGGRLYIKMSSYQYRNPHFKDKTVSRPQNPDKLIISLIIKSLT